MFSQEQKEEISKVLTSRLQKNGKITVCPMCNNGQFTLADAYISNTLQDDLKVTMLGGQTIPAIAIVCTNCGFISQHALGSLGLLPPSEEKK